MPPHFPLGFDNLVRKVWKEEKKSSFLGKKVRLE
jgi:hypothetical protein